MLMLIKILIGSFQTFVTFFHLKGRYLLCPGDIEREHWPEMGLERKKRIGGMTQSRRINLLLL